MPDGDGLIALSRLKLDMPQLPVLIFSTYDNPTYIARAVALGAKILAGEDDAAPEDLLPDAVDGDARSQRMIG